MKKIHLLVLLGPKSISVSHLHQTRSAKILKHAILVLFPGKRGYTKEGWISAEQVRSLARGLSRLRSKYIQWQQQRFLPSKFIPILGTERKEFCFSFKLLFAYKFLPEVL